MERTRAEDDERADPPTSERDGETRGEAETDPLAALHRSAGNQAVQSAFGGGQVETGSAGAGRAGGVGLGVFRSVTPAAGTTVYRQQTGESAGGGAEGQSVDEAVESAAGAETGAYSVAVSATVPEGVVHSDDEMTISATGETTIRASVTSNAVRITCDPGLIVEPAVNNWFDPNVAVSRITWPFGGTDVDVETNAPGPDGWVFDPQARAQNALGPILTQRLPSRMTEEGYDPFQDPNLEGAIQQLAGNLTFGSPPKTTAASLSASLSLGEAVTRGTGDFEVTLPAGTSLNLEVRLAGGLPESASATEIDAVDLEFGGAPGEDVHLNLSGSGAARDFPLIFLSGATLHSGGAVTLQYQLATEVIEGGVNALRALTGGPASRARGARELAEGSRQPALRERVNEVVDRQVEPMVRELVRKHRDAIPGVDLAAALDVSG